MSSALRYVTRADGTFAPDPTDQDGQPMEILGVKDRYGEVVDIVGWHPDNPGRWWLRLGDECPILGAKALALAAWYRRTVTLYPTPEAWLYARLRDRDQDAVCILDWSVDLRSLFEGVREVICTAPALESALYHALRSFEPRIMTLAGVRHAA